MNSLLRDAIILDTETTSLQRGAGIHELALYEMQSRKLTEYILNPNLVRVTPHTPQDVAKLVSSSKDLHQRIPVSSWQHAIASEIFAQTGLAGNPQAAFEALRWQNPFLYRALSAEVYPHLKGNAEDNTARASRFSRFGISSELGKAAAIEDIIGSKLPDHIKGKTVWIANVNFESKQIGAQIAAEQQAGVKLDWKNIFETYNQNPDPFHVTGVEVNKARVAAQITGDWRQVFEAYIKHPVKAGETGVRDIQDVLRSVMSYGREMNLFKGGSNYFGTGIDISHRLMAIAANDIERAGMRELHRAGEDAAIHEAYVLEKGIDYAAALRAVQEKTPTGELFKTLAQKQQGPLYEATRYFSLLEQAAPDIQRMNLLKRFGRAFEDIARTGATYQTLGPSGIFNMTQTTSAGTVKIPRIDYATQRFTDFDSVVAHLAQTGNYGDFNVNVTEEAERFKTAATSLQEASLYVDKEVSALGAKLAETKFTPSVSNLNNLADLSYESVRNNLKQGLNHLTPKRLAVGVGILTAIGAAWSLIQEKPKDQSSLLGFNYYDWLRSQEGMVNQGLAKETRSKNTDFGSPYRGPVVSNQVFADQEMMAERERWARAQYGATHYDPVSGLFGVFSSFRFRSGYSFLNEGEKVSAGYQGMRGNNLVALNLDEGWKITAEDADTILIQRKGIRGAMNSFFGLDHGYSFRLAGIDSPEISHEGKAAQPYAEHAKAALEEMINSGKSAEVVFDPTNMSYGRMLAGLMIDGKNINYELIKRGEVGHLPYGKQEDAIVNYDSMQKAEERAFRSNRGLWATPWGQTIYNATTSKERPTFNTLANMAKVVPNSGYMNLVAAANSATEGNIPDIGKIGSSADNIRPIIFDQDPSTIHLAELMTDTDIWMKTKGRKVQNKFSRRSGYGRLDQSMALDSTGTTNSVWTRRRYGVFDTYETSKIMRNERIASMAEKQREINNRMFQSPINHHEM